MNKIIYTFLSLIILLYFLCTTNLGLQLIFKSIAVVLPGKLSVAQIDGKFISRIRLKGLNYQSTDSVVTIDYLNLKWSPAQLVKKKIKIDQLSIDNININLSASKNRNDKFDIAQLSWIKSLSIDDLSIQQMKISQAQKIYLAINNFEIKPQANQYYSFLAKSSLGDIAGRYRLTWDKDLTWEIISDIKQLNLQTWVKNKKTNINATITSRGSWRATNPQFEFNLKNLSGTFDNQKVNGNADISYRNGVVIIKDSQLTIAKAYVKLSGTIDNQSTMTWQANIPSLQMIVPDARGKILAKGSIAGFKNNFDVYADLQVNQFSIPNIMIDRLAAKIDSKHAGEQINSSAMIKNLNSNGNIIPSIKLNIISRLLKNNLDSEINMQLDKQNQISGNVQLKNIDELNANTSINGQLTLLFKNLNKLIVSPHVKSIKGNLRADMQLSGHINNPNYLINAQIKQGQLHVPYVNINIKNINADSIYHAKQPIIFNGTFNVDNGRGKLQGKLNLDKPDLPLELILTGKHLPMVNLPEYKIKASPDISIQINRQETRIKGHLLDVSAQINPKDFSSVTTLPKETIILGKTSVKKDLPQNLILQLQIVLGEKNLISYENLEAELKGKLSISQKSGQLPTANGELYTVKGNYHAYGNSLKITEGRLIYTGNLLNNPGLYIKASKKLEMSSFAEDQSQFASDHKINPMYQGVKHMTVGIDVNGTLTKPKVSFYSNPVGMSQNDILSYLLFGYPQSEIKNMNGFEILNKVSTSLNNGNSKTEKFTKKIQNTFGLKNFGISSIETYDIDKNKSQSTSAVNIEKKLNKKFSIQYRMGIFNALSVLNIKYKINKLFALQSESSTQSNGVDLLFEYEHD